MKRLALFLDGTWNKPDDNTNVYRAWQLISDTDAAGTTQRRYYHLGVGTKWRDRFLGGLTGYGLDANLRDAYQWLVGEYEQGDAIYVLGFSRGAYTARSLAGLIARCGLLWPGSMFSVPQIFERYRQGKEAPALYEMELGFRKPRPNVEEDELLLQQSRLVDIEFIGVWDTVRALGFPGKIGQEITGKSNYFHSTNPSVRYRNMYQALAIDENRPAYRETLWTLFQPKDGAPPTLKPDQSLEQRWFVGAHCNLGGGYRNDPLAQLPLKWLLDKAEATGLRFKRPPQLSGHEYLADPVDSYGTFLKGAYRLLTLNHRYFRTIGGDPVPTKGTENPGLSCPVNETIDSSVFEHWKGRPHYRPKNLRDWANRRGKNLETLTGDQPAHD
jgi:uncharacterized protein (DUF2235 family)